MQKYAIVLFIETLEVDGLVRSFSNLLVLETPKRLKNIRFWMFDKIRTIIMTCRMVTAFFLAFYVFYTWICVLNI